jgi:hypothetical protein
MVSTINLREGREKVAKKLLRVCQEFVKIKRIARGILGLFGS